MITRRAQAWQLILADLALILFLVTLTALASETSQDQSDSVSDQTRDLSTPSPQIAQSQALYRSSSLGPSLEEWLSEQPVDPRATLTIFAQHTDNDRPVIWAQAQTLSDSASDKGFAVRVVITRDDVSDIYASLAYDNWIGESLNGVIEAPSKP